MQIRLDSAARRWSLLSMGVVFSLAFITLSACSFLAACFSSRGNLPNLQRATRLEPGNAQYRYRLGLLEQVENPSVAAQWFRSAVFLDPHAADYWLHLAATYSFLNDAQSLRNAMQHAVAAAPESSDVAWEAANTYMSLGDSEKALTEFRIALANGRDAQIVDRCWRIHPDPDFLMANVFPKKASVYQAFAELLMGKQDAADTSRVWQQIVRMQQPIQQRFVFEYMRFSLTHGDVDQALRVWQDAAGIASLANYQPSSENLVVNGDFSLPVLNGGLDWFYKRTANVTLALDPTQFYLAPRSLLIDFDRAQISDAGIYHFVPVQPNTEYEFAAYYKTADLQGAGGPEFVLQDAITNAPCYSSEELSDADFWKEVHGTFKTGPDTKLLAFLIQRIPAGDVIKGKLWIDGVQITPYRLEDIEQ